MKSFEIFRTDLQLYLVNFSIVFVLTIPFSLRAENAQEDKDPLEKTKRLVTKGHKDLYQNGAFEVPNTSIRLIPPGAESEIFIMGKRISFAEESFSLAVLRASESPEIFKSGLDLSRELGQETHQSSKALARKIDKNLTQSSQELFNRGKEKLSSGEWLLKLREIHKQRIEKAKQQRLVWDKMSDEWIKKSRDSSQKSKSILEKDFSKEWKDYKFSLRDESTRFITGYLLLPDQIQERFDSAKETFADDGYGKLLKEIETIRKEGSETLLEDFKDIFFSFGKETKQGLDSSKQDWSELKEGKSLSMTLLSSMGKATKAVLLDGILLPVSKAILHSVGYIVWNGVIYPVAVVTVSGGVGVYVTTHVVAEGTKGTIEIIAPSTRFAVYSVLNHLDLLYSMSASSMEYSKEKSISSTYFWGSEFFKLGGAFQETQSTYLLAPLESVGFSTSSVASESFQGSLEILGGGVLVGASKSASVGTETAGKIGEVGIVALGGTASAVTTVAYASYQSAKAIGVPVGVSVGSGVILSYETVAQLSSHSLLALGDMSYLVLSLEGGNWVLYAVQSPFRLNRSKTEYPIPTGAIVDLDKIRKQGGKVYKVENLSKEEQERILKSLDSKSKKK